MIEITVNGKKETVEEGSNIHEMIAVLDYTTKGAAVALNGSFVALKAYEETIIQSNDIVEILSPVQGG